MHPFIDRFLKRQTDSGAADLAGADVRLRIPLREPVVNEFLREMVVEGNTALQELRATVLAGNRLDIVIASLKIPLSSRVTLPCLLDPTLVVSPAPAVRVQIVREGIGHLGVFLPMAARFLPPEVTLQDGVLTIDLGSRLASRGLSWVTPFIKAGSFDTESGLLWLTLHLHVG